MRLEPKTFRPARALVLLAAAAAASCIFDDRHAGTSTSAENTILGSARLAGGGPAPGAAVSARTTEITLSDNHIPESKLIGFALADKDGRFNLKVPKHKAFYLEIRRRDSGPQVADLIFPDVYFREFRDTLAEATELGAVTLAPSGTLSGELVSERDLSDRTVWIGIPGMDNFILVPGPAARDSAVRFTLQGVPAGEHPLVVFLPSEVVIAGPTDTVETTLLGTATASQATLSNVGVFSVPLSPP
jgi:hypothetical protein